MDAFPDMFNYNCAGKDLKNLLVDVSTTTLAFAYLGLGLSVNDIVGSEFSRDSIDYIQDHFIKIVILTTLVSIALNLVFSSGIESKLGVIIMVVIAILYIVVKLLANMCSRCD